MRHEGFSIGLEFYTASGKWRCTDIGTRVIIAIRTDQVTVSASDNKNETMASVVRDDQSWFHGLPYSVKEYVFDAFDMGGCTLDAEEFS